MYWYYLPKSLDVIMIEQLPYFALCYTVERKRPQYGTDEDDATEQLAKQYWYGLN